MKTVIIELDGNIPLAEFAEACMQRGWRMSYSAMPGARFRVSKLRIRKPKAPKIKAIISNGALGHQVSHEETMEILRKAT